MLNFHKKDRVSRENKCQGILPAFMLESLVNLYFLETGVYMVVIADMICHIFQYPIQQQHDENFRQLC